MPGNSLELHLQFPTAQIELDTNTPPEINQLRLRMRSDPLWVASLKSTRLSDHTRTETGHVLEVVQVENANNIPCYCCGEVQRFIEPLTGQEQDRGVTFAEIERRYGQLTLALGFCDTCVNDYIPDWFRYKDFRERDRNTFGGNY